MNSFATPVFRAAVAASAQYGGLELIESIAQDWRQLCAEGVHDAPFFRPEWITTNLGAFAPAARVVLLTAHAGSQVRAVLPLMQERTLFCGIPARILRSTNNVHSYRFDLVHGTKDDAAAIACLWDRLKGVSEWDVLSLDAVPVGGAAERLVLLAAQEGYLTGQQNTIASPFIPITCSKPPIPRSSNLRHNLRRYLKRARAQWSVELRRYDEADAACLNEFYQLEKSGWKGERGTAIVCSSDTRAYYDAIAKVAARFGYFCLYLLYFDHKPVAGLLGVSYKGKYSALKIGYDEQHADLSPGHLITHSVVNDCTARGITEFDFLGPSMRWKLEWTSQTLQHARYYVFRKGVLGRMLHTAKVQVVPRLRSVARHSSLARVRDRFLFPQRQ
jgi:CelD/BcsL family acetyltransferase involved in cellulose biosynthesis